MGLKLNIREKNGVTIVDVSGRVTIGDGASALREKLREITDAGRRKILLNLADVTYLDSSGLGVLVSGFATVSNLGGQVKLLNLTMRMKDLLMLTKLYAVFHVFDDEETAVGSFGPAAATAPAA